MENINGRSYMNVYDLVSEYSKVRSKLPNLKFSVW